MLAAMVGMALTYSLTADRLARWGWRIPMLLGCLIVPFLFLLRRTLAETEVFLARKRHPSRSEVFRIIAANWRIVGLGTLLSTMTTVWLLHDYGLHADVRRFGPASRKYPRSDGDPVRRDLELCLAPVMGALSDRVGRRPILIATSIMTLVTAYPRCCGWWLRRRWAACWPWNSGCRACSAATTALWWCT